MLPAENPAFGPPRPGDVVITKEAGRFFLRVIPHPHRLSFAEYEKALRIATQWAVAANCGIWQTCGDGVYEPVSPHAGTTERATAEDRS